ncbi:hypothetical protein O6H91_05G084800 [Diphasiastrum complanatum]|nr:hypothetical protein O6H91_05G084800 [Diphasiastrum complanatum]
MEGHVMVAMKGHPGCGKSTIARALSKSLRVPLIDKDDIRDCLSLLNPLSSSSAAAFSALSYDVMWKIVQTQLQSGLSVIVDCPLARPHLFHTALSLSHRCGARLVIVECKPSDADEWKRRLETRAAAASATGSSDQDHGVASTLIHVHTDEPRSDSDIDSPTHSQGSGKQIRIEDQQSLALQLPPNYWHKPSKWEDLQKIIVEYQGCFNYDTGSVKKLIVDTTAMSTEATVVSVLEWLASLDNSLHTISSIQ